ncbi:MULTISPECIES: NAD-dependent epimerase/dehydratase family protein [Paenibacillus]|uniref:NAD-dependent epimerase/dehydratase family protein n=1 Tax=Paenibacillus TaxID=44249 RepID=UPI0022B91635|nr:NAD-dependent epimerase/dehydratase family protein [Paenibacillus caseinilyticus]MCZ8518249.1 GDP-mannose 4,6-dehydratase [Paenibacillus caseinilyticus]
MRVLITGGYGFIGSFVAERFFQEGCEVSIIDNLSSGDKRNVEFKHKSYLMSVEDGKCEEIFRNNRFDLVVHLAAQADAAVSLDNPRLDTQSNVLGLSNMLALSRKYGAGKFMFASTAAVYGMNGRLPLSESELCDPITPYGLNKWVGETYCDKWTDMYGLQTLSLRISNVYGPRQGSAGEGGVVSIFMNAALEGKELTVNGSGSQTRDFIYVEDVASAIYRASLTDLQGVYNLSTGKQSSVNDLIGSIRSLHGSAEAVYREPRTGDVQRSALDNTRLARALDWVPKYTLEEGLQQTYDWFLHHKPASQGPSAVGSVEPSSTAPLLRKLLPYAENLAAFALTAWLVLSPVAELYSVIDFGMVYIIVFGIIYGTRQSMVSVALSVVLYMYGQLGSGREVVSLLYDTDFFFQVAVYVFVGLVVGYSTERKSDAMDEKKRQLRRAEEKLEFLSEVYNETREIKDELQHQIRSNSDSFGKIYSIIKDLESLEPEAIFTSTISVMESLLKTRTVAIYTVNPQRTYLRLAARSLGGDEVPRSVKAEDSDLVQMIFTHRSLFINKELREGLPLMAAPVLINGEVAAIVGLYGLDFEEFTLYHQNLFQIVTNMVSSALSRALTYVEATSSQRYVDGTPVLSPAVFAEILAAKKLAQEKHGIHYVLLNVGAAKEVADEAVEGIARSLRETDYLGLGETGELLVLLSNTNPQDAALVRQRLEISRPNIRIAEGEEPVYV